MDKIIGKNTHHQTLKKGTNKIKAIKKIHHTAAPKILFIGFNHQKRLGLAILLVCRL